MIFVTQSRHCTIWPTRPPHPTTTQVFQCVHHNIRGVPVKGSNGDSMTKNNLSEHLSWLCISKPSKPPPGPSVPVITDSSTAGFFDDQYSVFAATQGELPNAGIDTLVTTGNSSPHPKIDRLDSGSRVQLPDTSYTFHEPQSMARLQSGPKSAAKKHLLSQNVPTQLPSPVPTETGSTRRPIRDVYDAQFRTQPLGEPQRIYCNVAACPIADTGDFSYSVQIKTHAARTGASQTCTITIPFPTLYTSAIDKKHAYLDCGRCRSYRRI